MAKVNKKLRKFRSELLQSEIAVDFAPMADCQEGNRILNCVEGIDNPMVVDAEPVAVAASEMMVGKCAEPQSHFVDFGFDARAGAGRELEEGGIKPRVKNLERRAHCNNQALRTRGLRPEFISCSDSRIADSNCGVKSSPSSTKSSSQSRTCRNSAAESFCNSPSICSTLLMWPKCPADGQISRESC